MLNAVDNRLIASGHVHQRRDFTHRHVRHVWAPSAGFIISDRRQEAIGTKQVGLMEYRFQPDSFEVRHIKAPGQLDIDLDSLLAAAKDPANPGRVRRSSTPLSRPQAPSCWQKKSPGMPGPFNLNDERLT